MRGQKKHCEATLVRADGVVSSAKLYRPEDCAGLTTPSAPSGGFAASLLMSRPPLLFEEGSCRSHWVTRTSALSPPEAQFEDRLSPHEMPELRRR